MNNNKNSGYFAVIDTETNIYDQVMSIGAVIADPDTFKSVAARYYILSPECNVYGIYSSVLHIKGQKTDLISTRENVISDFINVLNTYNVNNIFAYNARFDYGHLPELSSYRWFDIMKIAAYKQYNPAIPDTADCCRTGRLKSNYGVEAMMRLLSGSRSYHEVHNALCDAEDELELMKLLGHHISYYEFAKIN